MTTRFPIDQHARRARPLLVLALAAVAPTALAGEPISQRSAADPTGQVEISNTSGSVVVTGWNRNEIEVTGELGEGSERLEFSRAEQLTRVKVILPKRTSHVEGSDLIVKVPVASSIAVITVSADVRVQGVRGAQRLQTVSGDIQTAVVGEDLECKTVSGDVRVTGSDQHSLTTVMTVSGDATLERLAGEVNGNTVSGNITASMGEVIRSRLRSTSGDLGVTGRLAPDARLDFESMSGNVRVDLAGPVSAEFDMSSFNGDISNCFGPKAARTDEYAPGTELRFRQGTGGARVRIKTFNGDIRLCNK